MTDNLINEDTQGTFRKDHDNRKKKLIILISVLAAVLVCAAVFLLIFLNGRNRKIYSLPGGIVASEVDGKWGYVDDSGKFVIKPRFDMAYCFSDYGLARVEVGDKWGYIDKTGKIVIEPQFDDALPFSDDGLARVEVDDKWGYIDDTGEYVIEPQFYMAYPFADNGIARVEVGINPIVVEGKTCYIVKTGYINKKGEFIFPATLEYGPDFNDKGVAPITVTGGQKAFIDENGNFTTETGFDQTDFKFYEGLCKVRADKLWGFVDEYGKIVVEPQFEREGNFSGGLAWVVKDGKTGFIDKKGALVIDCQFEGAYPFGRDRETTKVKYNGNWGLIDRKGEFVLDPIYDDLNYFGEKGLAVASIGGKYGFINESGEFVVEPKYDQVYSFDEDGFSQVILDGKWGLVNEKGEVVIEPKYERMGMFVEGLAGVKVGDKWGFINTNGDVVIEPIYDSASYFDGRGLNLVRLDGEKFYINKKGERVDDTAAYAAARLAEGEFGIASVNGKYGIVNSKAEYVVEPIYDQVITHGEYAECRIGNHQCAVYKMNGELVFDLPYNEIIVFPEHKLIAVRDNNKWGFVDFEGNLVVDVQYSEPYRYFDTGLIFAGSGHYVDKNGNVLHLEFEK